MTLHVTYCSREKKRGEGLSASERYDSARIDRIHGLAEEEDEPFAVLSGKFGLVEPDEEVPFYDQLLADENMEQVAEDAADHLEGHGITEARYFTRPVEGERKVYRDCIREACEIASVELETIVFDDLSQI
ncbi:MAG: hypothetical protein ABEJ64_03535 [Candidatus Nanohaloarchaea archaeon]